eukprot:6103832-Pyramimonas_sp.AAC.1
MNQPHAGKGNIPHVPRLVERVGDRLGGARPSLLLVYNQALCRRKLPCPSYGRVVCESPNAEHLGSLGDPAAMLLGTRGCFLVGVDVVDTPPSPWDCCALLGAIQPLLSKRRVPAVCHQPPFDERCCCGLVSCRFDERNPISQDADLMARLKPRLPSLTEVYSAPSRADAMVVGVEQQYTVTASEQKRQDKRCIALSLHLSRNLHVVVYKCTPLQPAVFLKCVKTDGPLSPQGLREFHPPASLEPRSLAG